MPRLIQNIRPKSLAFSNASVPRICIPYAVSGWPLANKSCCGTAAVFGWSPHLAEDPTSNAPFPNPPSPAVGTNEESLGRPPSPAILLVEDNSSDVYVIRQVLKRCGLPISLRVAVDGEEALAMIQRTTGPLPSLVLLDWNLPRVSGAEVLFQLRQSEGWRDIPVVIVTSTSSPTELTEMMRLGATGHFRKPTDLDAYLDLGNLIRKTLAKAAEE
jgi:CheY-like chemotaxis protein